MKRIAVFLIFAILCSGCTARKPPDLRVVTGVQVQYEQPGRTLTRSYTKPASIQYILNYLRILRPFGPVNPEPSQEVSCRFTLQYSQGPDSVYLQQGNRYLRRDDGNWGIIDSARAALLFPLLLLLPSDQ